MLARAAVALILVNALSGCDSDGSHGGEELRKAFERGDGTVVSDDGRSPRDTAFDGLFKVRIDESTPLDEATAAEVRALLGRPARVATVEGQLRWTYVLATRPGPRRPECVRTASVDFDNNGRVVGYVADSGRGTRASSASCSGRSPNG